MKWISIYNGNIRPKKGKYYFVKHYNHSDIQVMFFNGHNFEGFKSDEIIHDEIECWKDLDLPKEQT